MKQQKHIQTTVMITGSTGYICRFFVKKLIDETNFKIVVTYRKTKGNHKDNSRLFFEKANLLEPQTYEQIFDNYKPTYVVHLAAMARVSDGENYPEKVIKANYIATISLAEMCIRYGVNSMIFASSNLAQDAVSVVGIGKFLIEQYFQKLNSQSTKFISIRMPNVIDSDGAVTLIFKKQIEYNNPITITHPAMSRMFVTGERAANLLLYLLIEGHNRGVYVSYDKPIKITDLAQRMIKDSGKDIKIKYIGMKVGEKLSEKSFALNEVIKTNVSGLGLIKEYTYDLSLINIAIAKLNLRDEIFSSKEIQNSFEKLNND